MYEPPKLSYRITQAPAWRVRQKGDLVTTDEMITEIFDMKKQYDNGPPSIKSFNTQIFARYAAVEFVCKTNYLEGVGTQDPGQTKDVLLRMDKKEKGSREERESIQTLEALTYLHDQYLQAIGREGKEGKEGEEGGERKEEGEEEGEEEGPRFPNEEVSLTEGQIMEMHKLLMAELLPPESLGKERTTFVGCMRDSGEHHYLAPDLIKSHMTALMDDYLESLTAIPTKLDTNVIGSLFKLSAWFLATFLAIHPFVDGNGRMGRLLANHPLRQIAPFPVTIAPPFLLGLQSVAECRSIFLAALIKAQDRNDPSDLCALMVESAYAQWCSLFNQLRTSALLQSVERPLYQQFHDLTLKKADAEWKLVRGSPMVSSAYAGVLRVTLSTCSEEAIKKRLNQLAGLGQDVIQETTPLIHQTCQQLMTELIEEEQRGQFCISLGQSYWKVFLSKMSRK